MTEPVTEPEPTTEPHLLSVVVPVYRGELTLPALCAELATLNDTFTTPGGHRARVGEVILVHDNGPDRSAAVIRALAAELGFVQAVWLSRNFGQHAATLAGMASSGGDWVVTLDEDGQHDPAYIGAMLDVAMSARASVVYADPTNTPPHGWVRNLADGSVEVVLEGDVESVDRVEATVRRGPPSARVERFDVEDQAPTGRATGFSIR